MRVREGNNVRLTGKDLRDYIKKRFPDTCLVCLGRPSKTPKCKRCGGTGMRNEVWGLNNLYIGINKGIYANDSER